MTFMQLNDSVYTPADRKQRQVNENNSELVTEWEIVVTGSIASTKAHHLATKCHDTRSAFYMT